MPKFPNLCPSSNSYVLVVNSPAAFSALVTGLFPCHAPVTRGMHLLWPSIGKVMILTGKLKPGHTHTHKKCPCIAKFSNGFTYICSHYFPLPKHLFFHPSWLGLAEFKPCSTEGIWEFQVISSDFWVNLSGLFSQFSWEHLTLWAAQLINFQTVGEANCWHERSCKTPK